MTDYDGYTIIAPDYSLSFNYEIDEATSTSYDYSQSTIYSSDYIDEATSSLYSFDISIIYSASDLDDLTTTHYIKPYGTVAKKPSYTLRAIDSGLSAPGYVYWQSFSFDYTDAPTPIGSYTDLSILDIKTVTQIS